MTQLDSIYGIQSHLSCVKIFNALSTSLIDTGTVISFIGKSTLERMIFPWLESADIQSAPINGFSFVLLERIAHCVNCFMAEQFSRNLFFGSGYICPITFRTGFPLTFKFSFLVQLDLGKRIL